MDLTSYVESLRSQLANAAAAGGEAAVEMAERLSAPLDSAARLVIQEALSDAAQAITVDLAPGSVELRLRGRDIEFVVTAPPVAAPSPPLAAAISPPEAPGDGGTSRISFRPPESLKARIEDAAERDGVSVNAFLVRTLTALLDPGAASLSSTEAKGGTRVDGWFR